jgi:hypothetical protein
MLAEIVKPDKEEYRMMNGKNKGLNELRPFKKCC